jgi:hypothetical protein
LMREARAQRQSNQHRLGHSPGRRGPRRPAGAELAKRRRSDSSSSTYADTATMPSSAVRRSYVPEIPRVGRVRCGRTSA